MGHRQSEWVRPERPTTHHHRRRRPNRNAESSQPNIISSASVMTTAAPRTTTQIRWSSSRAVFYYRILLTQFMWMHLLREAEHSLVNLLIKNIQSNTHFSSCYSNKARACAASASQFIIKQFKSSRLSTYIADFRNHLELFFLVCVRVYILTRFQVAAKLAIICFTLRAGIV